MTTGTARTWSEANQDHLTAALERLRALLDGSEPSAPPSGPADGTGRAPALPTLATAFGLSAFERDLLLLCAAPELDARFTVPDFATALARLPGAHWSALAPNAPLRRWRLVEPAPGSPLVQAPLRAAERVVHHLAGVQTLDPEIEAMVDVTEPRAGRLQPPPSHGALADRAVRALTAAAGLGSLPLVQLTGRAADAREVASAVAAGLGVGLAVLHADDVPATAQDRERLARLWEREAVLSGLLLLVDASELGDDPRAATAVTRFLEMPAGPILVLARHPLPGLRRDDVRLQVVALPPAERLACWHAVLPDPDPELQIDRIAGQFALGVHDVRAVLGELALREPAGPEDAGRILWDLCRERSRPRLEHLTDRITTTTAWDHLVLPDRQKQTLRQIAAQARTRHRVHGEWGFAAGDSRGLGVSALFAGPSGTGKTMAAEALAELLRLDLHRIDLSRVVSKYIGETERNLGRIFDEAQGSGGVVLLFDEADALFGKRTEVRDSHDRYANLEVSYLLQRMEAYDGLAVLTTNLKNSLDPAFLRRLRFVINFPFPDAAARERIWRGAFPPAAPVDGLAYDRLAALTVAGGNIRGIALNAAFAAADAGGPITMAHLLTAARAEYSKLERSLPDSEIRGWT